MGAAEIAGGAGLAALGPAALGTAGALGEGLLTSAFNLYENDKARDWNEEMSSTMHQREVADLRAAGLNPILSAKGGGSAVAPVPPVQASNFDVTGKALQAMQMRQQQELMSAQINNVNADTRTKNVTADIAERTKGESIDSIREGLYQLRGQADLTYGQKVQLDKLLKQLDIETDIKSNERAQSGYELFRSKNEADFQKGPGGKVSPYIRQLLDVLKGVR